jgi:hypothetical protein
MDTPADPVQDRGCLLALWIHGGLPDWIPGTVAVDPRVFDEESPESVHAGQRVSKGLSSPDPRFWGSPDLLRIPSNGIPSWQVSSWRVSSWRIPGYWIPDHRRSRPD